MLFFTRYSNNELGQIKPGSTAMDKSIALAPLGVQRSVGALSFVPAGFPRAGDLGVMSFNTRETYLGTLVPDGNGTYDIASLSIGPRVFSQPEGFLYVPPDSPHFLNFQQMLVCEYGVGEIAVYDVNGSGEPDPATRQVFMSGVSGCLGAAIDPVSGDFVFSTYGTNTVLVVQGFGIPCGRIIHYGSPTAGAGGFPPAMTSAGCFARKQTVSIDVSNGLGGALGVLMAGVQPVDQPLGGIRVLVSPLIGITHTMGGCPGCSGRGLVFAAAEYPRRVGIARRRLLLPVGLSGWCGDPGVVPRPTGCNSTCVDRPKGGASGVTVVVHGSHRRRAFTARRALHRSGPAGSGRAAADCRARRR